MICCINVLQHICHKATCCLHTVHLFIVHTTQYIVSGFVPFLPNPPILSTASFDLRSGNTSHFSPHRFLPFVVISGFIALPGARVKQERDWRRRNRKIFKAVKDGVSEFLFAISGEATKQGFYYSNWQGTNSAFKKAHALFRPVCFLLFRCQSFIGTKRVRVFGYNHLHILTQVLPRGTQGNKNTAHICAFSVTKLSVRKIWCKVFQSSFFFKGVMNCILCIFCTICWGPLINYNDLWSINLDNIITNRLLFFGLFWPLLWAHCLHVVDCSLWSKHPLIWLANSSAYLNMVNNLLQSIDPKHRWILSDITHHKF